MVGMIKIYGKVWCGDCTRAKRVFDDNDVAYEYIDIEKESQYIDYVLQLNNGHQSVPTIVFPDGSVLVEPSNLELTKKLAEVDLP